MKTKKVTLKKMIGKTIAEISSNVIRSNSGKNHTNIDAIYFTDGTRLLLTALEGEDFYIISGVLEAKPKAGAK